MSRKGLGKGLDALIPDFYDDDFDSNSPQSLEDILNDNDDAAVEPDETPDDDKNIFEEAEEENVKTDEPEEEVDSEETEENQTSEEISGDKTVEDDVSSAPEINSSHIDEVTQIVDKNPRITLWSSRSAAVLRYLRKTEPEFSISKEASTLIDEAVSKKYPEIWELFDQY